MTYNDRMEVHPVHVQPLNLLQVPGQHNHLQIKSVLIDCNRGSCSSKDNDSTTTVAAESIVVAQRQLQQKNLEIAQGKLQQKR